MKDSDISIIGTPKIGNDFWFTSKIAILRVFNFAPNREKNTAKHCIIQ